MGGHVIGRILNLHLATGGISFDAATGMGDANYSRDGFDADIAFHVRNRDIAGSTGDLDIASYVTSRDRATRSRDLGVAVDFFHANRTRGGVDLYGATQIADVLCAGGDIGIHFGVMRDLNVVGDANVPQVREVRADANGVAPLLDGRIRNGVVEPLLPVVNSEPGRSHLSVHVHFAIGTAGDIHVARGILKFQANG